MQANKDNDMEEIIGMCEEMGVDFQTASSNEVFEAVVHYDGLLGSYPARIKQWVRDIYGIDLDKANLLKDATNIARYLMTQDPSGEIRMQLAALLDALEFLGTIQS